MWTSGQEAGHGPLYHLSGLKIHPLRIITAITGRNWPPCPDAGHLNITYTSSLTYVYTKVSVSLIGNRSDGTNVVVAYETQWVPLKLLSLTFSPKTNPTQNYRLHCYYPHVTTFKLWADLDENTTSTNAK